MTEQEFEIFQKQFNESKDEYQKYIGFIDSNSDALKSQEKNIAKAKKAAGGTIENFERMKTEKNTEKITERDCTKKIEALKNQIENLKKIVDNAVKEKAKKIREEYENYCKNKKVDELSNALGGSAAQNNDAFTSNGAIKSNLTALEKSLNDNNISESIDLINSFPKDMDNLKEGVEVSEIKIECKKLKEDFDNYYNEVKDISKNYDNTEAIHSTIVSKSDVVNKKMTSEEGVDVFKKTRTELVDKIKEFKDEVLKGFKNELETLKKDYEDSFKDVKVGELVKDLSDETKKLIDDQKKNIESVINTKIEKEEDVKTNKDLPDSLKTDIGNLKKSTIDAVKSEFNKTKKEYEEYKNKNPKVAESIKNKDDRDEIYLYINGIQRYLDGFNKLKDGDPVSNYIFTWGGLKKTFSDLKNSVEFSDSQKEYLKLQQEFNNYCKQVNIDDLIKRESSIRVGNKRVIANAKDTVEERIKDGLKNKSILNYDDHFKSTKVNLDVLKQVVNDFVDEEKKVKGDLVNEIKDKLEELGAANEIVKKFNSLTDDYKNYIIGSVRSLDSTTTNGFVTNSYLKAEFSSSIQKLFNDYSEFFSFKYNDNNKSVEDLKAYREAIGWVENVVAIVCCAGYNFIAHIIKGEDINNLTFFNWSVMFNKNKFETCCDEFEDIKKGAPEGEKLKEESGDDCTLMFVRLYNISISRDKMGNQKNDIDKKRKEITSKYKDVSGKYDSINKILDSPNVSKYKDIILKYADELLKKEGNTTDIYREYNKDAVKLFRNCAKFICNVDTVDKCNNILNSLKSLATELAWIEEFGLQFLQDNLR